MAEIIEYAFEDRAGNEASTWTTQNLGEALEHGRRYGLRVIAREYEFSDSTTVEDFTRPFGDPGATMPDGHAFTIMLVGAETAHEDMADTKIAAALRGLFGAGIEVRHVLSEAYWPLVFDEVSKRWGCGQCGSAELKMVGLLEVSYDIEPGPVHDAETIAVRMGHEVAIEDTLDDHAVCTDCDARLEIPGELAGRPPFTFKTA